MSTTRTVILVSFGLQKATNSKISELAAAAVVLPVDVFDAALVSLVITCHVVSPVSLLMKTESLVAEGSAARAVVKPERPTATRMVEVYVKMPNRHAKKNPP